MVTRKLLEQLKAIEVIKKNQMVATVATSNEREVHSAEVKLIEEIIEIVQNFSEGPKFVTVLPFVAQWYEENVKDNLDLAIIEYMADTFGDDFTDFGQWMEDPENLPFQTLVLMKDGYVISEEST